MVEDPPETRRSLTFPQYHDGKGFLIRGLAEPQQGEERPKYYGLPGGPNPNDVEEIRNLRTGDGKGQSSLHFPSVTDDDARSFPAVKEWIASPQYSYFRDLGPSLSDVGSLGLDSRRRTHSRTSHLAPQDSVSQAA